MLPRSFGFTLIYLARRQSEKVPRSFPSAEIASAITGKYLMYTHQINMNTYIEMNVRMYNVSVFVFTCVFDMYKLWLDILVTFLCVLCNYFNLSPGARHLRANGERRNSARQNPAWDASFESRGAHASASLVNGPCVGYGSSGWIELSLAGSHFRG